MRTSQAERGTSMSLIHGIYSSYVNRTKMFGLQPAGRTWLLAERVHVRTCDH
jgi:hypothetical protein